MQVLELRRMQVDLTMMYKIIYKSVCRSIDCLKLSQCVSTRGNMFKIANESAKLDLRKYFFCIKNGRDVECFI